MADQTEPLLFLRFIGSSLDRLVACLEGLSADELNWRPQAPAANSLYALAIHTLGNAEENILETLGGQVVGRDRKGEFAVSGDSVEAVAARWRELRERLAWTLTELPASALDAEYSHPRRGTVTGRAILIVVARHAAEHLGQAELTRDLLRAMRG